VSATNSGGTGTLDLVRDVASGAPGALTSPAAGSTLMGLAHFTFTPAPGFVSSFPISQVSSCLSTGGCAQMYNVAADGTWPTTVLSGTLTSGPASLSTTVSFMDPLGVAHTWTDSARSVNVNATGEALQATLSPPQGAAPLATTLAFSASDPNGLPLQYSVDYGDGSASATGTTSYPYDTVSLVHHFTTAGLYAVTVSTSNGAGGTAVQYLNERVTAASLPVQFVAAPATGAAPLTTAFTLTTSDPSGAPIMYSVPYGDGSVDSGTITATPGSPPTYAPVTLHHTYLTAGTFAAGASVSDAAGVKGSAIATVTASGVVTLRPNAGDPQEAVLGLPVAFDGTGSQPSGAITAYQWTFGDGSSGSGAAPSHAYAATGTYAVALTITSGGQQAVAHTQVTVIAAPAPSQGTMITVTDGASPLPGALLAVVAPDGTRYSATTDAQGKGTLAGLPDGAYTVYVFQSGYLPGTVAVSQTGGVGSATIALTAGAISQTSATSSALDYQQILAAGLDPSDPANQNVFKFEIHLAFVAGPTTQNVQVGGYINGNGVWQPVITGGGPGGGGGGGGGSCSLCFSAGGNQIVGQVTGTPNQPAIMWMIIPGQAQWLKEFFDVKVLVSNLAPAPFSFDSGTVSLDALPAGLSLAPTAVPQQTTQAMANIPAGGSQSVDWVLRGDAEGFYGVSATYQGILDPVLQTPLNFPIATAPGAIHVWGGSALQMTVDADSVANAGDPYLVRVGFRNVSDVPVYNFTVQLLDSPSRLNYIYQPLEQLAQGTAAIQPGATFWSKYYRLIPTITGILNPALSYVTKTGGNVTLPPPAIISHPAAAASSVPVLSASSQSDGVHLSWPASTATGVTGYQVFFTPTRSTSFGATALQSVGAATTSTVITNGTPGCYAVSTVTASGNTLYHSLACVTTGALGITTPSLPPATKGHSYTATLAAIGGNAPYTWKLVTGLGKLPKGLNLNLLTGVLSGTVSAKAVTTTFSVEAFDAKVGKPKTQNHAIKVFTLTVS
jgi:hypothetical protein